MGHRVPAVDVAEDRGAVLDFLVRVGERLRPDHRLAEGVNSPQVVTDTVLVLGVGHQHDPHDGGHRATQAVPGDVKGGSNVPTPVQIALAGPVLGRQDGLPGHRTFQGAQHLVARRPDVPVKTRMQIDGTAVTRPWVRHTKLRRIT